MGALTGGAYSGARTGCPSLRQCGLMRPRFEYPPVRGAPRPSLRRLRCGRSRSAGSAPAPGWGSCFDRAVGVGAVAALAGRGRAAAGDCFDSAARVLDPEAGDDAADDHQQAGDARCRGGRPRSRRRRRRCRRGPPGRAAAARSPAPPAAAPWRRRSRGSPRGPSGRSPRSPSRVEPKLAEITAPSTAIASRPATRETPLLTPEAMPTWRSSTESSTVAVSGATVAERPRPKTRIAGSTSVDVVGVGADPQQQQQADAADDRADRHRQPRPGARGEPAEARREEEEDQRDRRRRQPRLERRVAGRPAGGRGRRRRGRRSARRRR